MIDENVRLQVWRARPEEGFGQVEALRGLLMDWERERAERLKLAALRTRYVTVHGLLHCILAQVFTCSPEQVMLAAGEKGKPFLLEPAGKAARLRFSLTHSGAWMLVGLGWGCEVGVDVQVEEEKLESELIARRFFSAADNAWLESLPAAERKPAFYRLWTLKEAVLKADGRGLEGGLERVQAARSRQASESSILRVASQLGEESYTCWSFAAGAGCPAALAAPAACNPTWDGKLLDYPASERISSRRC